MCCIQNYVASLYSNPKMIYTKRGLKIVQNYVLVTFAKILVILSLFCEAFPGQLGYEYKDCTKSGCSFYALRQHGLRTEVSMRHQKCCHTDPGRREFQAFSVVSDKKWNDSLKIHPTEKDYPWISWPLSIQNICGLWNDRSEQQAVWDSFNALASHQY